MMYNAPFMLGYAGWYAQETTRNILFYIPFQQLFLIGPVIYFYLRSLLSPNQTNSIDLFYHFLPAIVYNLAMLVVFVNDVVIQSDYYFYADGKDMDLDPWYQWAGLVSMVAYLVLSINYYQKYKRALYDSISYADELVVNWVQHFLVAFLIVLLLRVLFFILNPEWGEFGNKFWYYFCFSVLFIYIGFRGYIHALKIQLIAPNQFDDRVIVNQLLEFSATADQVKLEEAKEQDDISQESKDDLVFLMSEKQLFKNPQLSISDIAQQIGTHPKQISTIVNKGFGVNFNDWVNQYRVQEVISHIDAGELETKTLLALAIDAGFNSKSTFNRAFKKQMGISPNQYVKSGT